MKHEKSKWHTQTPTPRSAVPYACEQPYHPGSGSHGQLFRPCLDSSAWHSPRPGLTYDHRPSRLLPRRVHKHSFKRQLHTTHVVVVGWGQHGRPPTACVWGGGSAFLPIGVSVNLKWNTRKTSDTLKHQPRGLQYLTHAHSHAHSQFTDTPIGKNADPLAVPSQQLPHVLCGAGA